MGFLVFKSHSNNMISVVRMELWYITYTAYESGTTIPLSKAYLVKYVNSIDAKTVKNINV